MIKHEKNEVPGSSGDGSTGDRLNPDLSLAAIANASMVGEWSGKSQYQNSLEILQKYFKDNPAKARGNFALTLAEVKVENRAGAMVPRTVGFVSKGGLPSDLLQKFTKAGVPIYRADAAAGKGHAEDAAAAFRANLSGQKSDLGGPIKSVTSAYVNIRICSDHCAAQLTKFVGNEDITFKRLDNGMINGRVINASLLKQLRATVGRGGALDVVLRSMTRGLFGSARGSRR